MVHIMRYVCAAGHSFNTNVWDDTEKTRDAAAAQLLEDVGHRSRACVCQICGSHRFHIDDRLTDHETITSAMSDALRMNIDDMVEVFMNKIRGLDRN
jgi:hypothetical protein